MCAFTTFWMSEDPEEVGLSEHSSVKLRALSSHLRKLVPENGQAKSHDLQNAGESWDLPVFRVETGAISFEFLEQVTPPEFRSPRQQFFRAASGRSPPVVSL